MPSAFPNPGTVLLAVLGAALLLLRAVVLVVGLGLRTAAGLTFVFVAIGP